MAREKRNGYVGGHGRRNLPPAQAALTSVSSLTALLCIPRYKLNSSFRCSPISSPCRASGGCSDTQHSAHTSSTGMPARPSTPAITINLNPTLTLILTVTSITPHFTPSSTLPSRPLPFLLSRTIISSLDNPSPLHELACGPACLSCAAIASCVRATCLLSLVILWLFWLRITRNSPMELSICRILPSCSRVSSRSLWGIE